MGFPPPLVEGEEVQWFGGSGSGVRSFALYGITKVHIVDAETWRTRCGVRIARRSKRTSPTVLDSRCKRCSTKVPAKPIDGA